MLPGRRTHTTLPTSDLERSRGFYEGSSASGPRMSVRAA